MVALNLYAVQASDGQVAQIARTFGVDWPHLTAQIVSFAVVCVVLYFFAYRRVLAMLAERRAQIASGLENARKIQAELDRIEAQRQAVMTRAYAESAKVVEDARAVAARTLQEQTRKAVVAAELITARAREAAARDHDRMLAELKQEVGRLVVLATTAVTGKILSAQDHRRLAEEAAKQAAA